MWKISSSKCLKTTRLLFFMLLSCELTLNQMFPRVHSKETFCWTPSTLQFTQRWRWSRGPLFLLPWEDKINAGLSIKPRRWSFLTRLSDQAAGLIDKHPTTKQYVDTRCKLCSHKSDLHQISNLQLTDWTFLHLNPPKTDFSKRCYHLKLLINWPDCLPKAELQLPRTQMRLNSVV